MAIKRGNTVAASSEAASSVSAGIKSTEAEETKEQKDGSLPPNFGKIVSTGSTLLDLTISGGRLEYGGIPTGIFVEIFGPSGAGKTALLSELSASVQNQGGSVKFCDPEARLDQQYTEIYGVSVKDQFSYCKPDTVSELFVDEIWHWETPNDGRIHMIAADSLAALSTNMEMDNDDGDKMGMRRAKEFSEGLRKTCRIINEKDWLIVASNQVRTGENGKMESPGGQAIGFYASLRIRVKPGYPQSKIIKKKKIGRKEVEHVMGIQSECFIHKSSVDVPYRKCPLSIIFGYGIDDIRDQLQYFKDLRSDSNYDCFSKSVVSMDDAIRYIEDHDLTKQLKDRTVELWNEVQDKFKFDRPKKKR